MAGASSVTGDSAGEMAYLALGSNQGDRDALLALGVSMLDATPGVGVVAVSRVFETDPVGPPPQSPYLNAVVKLDSTLSPASLLECMWGIERTAGRVRGRDGSAEPLRWGPRPLDLDLLLYGNRCIDEPRLQVPHPRLHLRAFVLEPLCDLAAEIVHPRLGETIEALARRVRNPKGVRPWPHSIAFESSRRSG